MDDTAANEKNGRSRVIMRLNETEYESAHAEAAIIFEERWTRGMLVPRLIRGDEIVARHKLDDIGHAGHSRYFLLSRGLPATIDFRNCPQPGIRRSGK